VVLLVASSPLGKRRSRDAKDDPFLACALGSNAEFIVTKDKDLLALEKPFGVETITPGEFYRRVESWHHGLGLKWTPRKNAHRVNFDEPGAGC